jgi:lysophospholipase L1-like esterase
LVDDQGGLPAIYSKDGVHPNPAGYAVMEKVLMATLKRYL